MNQLQLANIDEFKTFHRGVTCAGTSFEVVLDRFHSEVNGVMHVKVSYPPRDGPFEPVKTRVPVVDWTVVRTLTDNEASTWWKKGPRPADERTMSGRIDFVRKRTPADLRSWSQRG